ncbi:hypothetical protein MNBD_ALPHA05-257, partial [hydrothermal vent metagenome]
DEGGLGALAFALRADTIDLENAPTSGGAYNSYTVGADWWLTERIRLGVNGYIVDADLGETPSGLDAAFAGAVLAGLRDETVRGVAASRFGRSSTSECEQSRAKRWLYSKISKLCGVSRGRLLGGGEDRSITTAGAEAFIKDPAI